ncbi:Gag-Pol polyprotein, partial [Bienertia sinuspersici]
MKAIWVELETLNMLPPITSMNVEINRFVQALNKQKEEMRLFRFLNGHDEEYGTQRSQILMMTKLPIVDEACNMIQQEESQRELFGQRNNEGEVLAMTSKKADTTCSNCGKTGHSTDKCWACKACGKPGHSYKRNAMHIPEFRNNLMSIQKLTEDGKCRTIFHQHYCIVEDCETNQDVLLKLKLFKKRNCNTENLAAAGQLSVPTTVKQKGK